MNAAAPNSPDAVLTVLYVGSHHLAAVAAKAGEKDVILGAAQILHPEGFQRGVTANLEKAIATLEALIKDLAKAAKISEAVILKGQFYAVLGRAQQSCYSFSSSKYFQSMHRTISPEDVELVIEQTKKVATLPLTDQILYSLPVAFTVNDLTDVDDPVGLDGRRLGVTLSLFTMAYEDYRNLSKTFEAAEISVRQYFPKGLVTSASILTPSEKQDGGLLIDIAHDGVFLTLWSKGHMVASEVLDAGFDYLVKSVGEQWQVDPPDAERIVMNYGSLAGQQAFGEELIPLVRRNDKETHAIPRALFDERFKEFAQGWLENMVSGIKTFTMKYRLHYPHYVFSGEGAHFDGFLEFLHQRFELPARLGYIRKQDTDYDFIRNPSLAPALAGWQWLAAERARGTHLDDGLVKRIVRRAKILFETYF